MTPKERAAENLHEIAKAWESGKILETITKETGCSGHTIRMLLLAHFGESRYAEISLNHRKINCFRKGNKFQPGNRMYQRRTVNRGNPRYPIGSITIWRQKGGPRRYVKVKDGHSVDCWRPVSQMIWEKLHGPIPHGHFVNYIDGDTLHDEPENYRLVSRADMARTAVARCDNDKRIEKIVATKQRQGTKRRLAAERIQKLLSMRESAA